ASPRVSPFVDVRDAGSLLQRAGFALPVVDSERIMLRYENPLKLLADLRGMGETSILRERPRRPLKRDTLMAALQVYAKRHVGEDGRVAASFDLITLTAWKAHESQQQPAKRGSGKTHLSEVLKNT